MATGFKRSFHIPVKTDAYGLARLSRVATRPRCVPGWMTGKGEIMKFAEMRDWVRKGPAGDAEKVLGDRHRAGCRGSHDRPGGWRRIPRPR